MRPGSLLRFLFLASIAFSCAGIPTALAPVDLRCEYRTEPLGIDAAQPRLSWVLEAAPGARDVRQSAYRVLVASSAEKLAANEGDLWDSGRIESSEQNNIPYSGRPLASGETCHWKVEAWDEQGAGRWSAPARFEMGLLRPEDWVAHWIGDGKPDPASDAGFYADDPAPLFRKEFALRGPVARARLYVTGLGSCEASLNGERIGDDVLAPVWTAFEKRVCYRVHDVTAQLEPGTNCLGARLGKGWYDPLPLRMWGNLNLREHLATGRPRLCAQLQIEYRDGTRETLATDANWKTGDSGILRDNLYLGELVDARREPIGWDRAGFDDSRWRAAALAEPPRGALVAQSEPPIRITGHWPAVSVHEPEPGVFVYDCGVNFSGWVRLQLDVPSGTKVELRYGELLHPDGRLNPRTSVAGQIKGVRPDTHESLGGPGAPPVAWQADTYIARGGGETYTPRFTWHGFRYVEIRGLPSALPPSAVTALRLHSDVESAGSFECSNPLLDRIQEICRRTFLSNLVGVQSDCPHRERFGYGGDIVATSEALMANFDMCGFYEKTVRDQSDSARADGLFTDTAPFVGIQYCGVVWAMAQPLLCEQLARIYGDRRIGAEHFEAAKRWLLRVEQLYPDGIVTDGLSDHEGLAPAPAPEMVTPFYHQSAKLLAAAAKRLARTQDEAHFLELAQKIASAYQARFVDAASGKVGPGTQASQAIALATGIVPDSARAAVLAFLVREIEARGRHLSTGILGTKFMLDVLSREGRADLAYAIATQTDFPGWGWMLANGATSLWEHWEASDDTFSHDHPMFGSVSQWMLHWLGGIQPDPEAAGFDRIVIRPQAPPGLDWVKSSYRSIRGTIVSNWKRVQGGLEFEIELPPNTRARIVLPGKELTVGSGRYTFRA